MSGIRIIPYTAEELASLDRHGPGMMRDANGELPDPAQRDATNKAIIAGPGRELITGNTYPVKDQLKALGGRWNRIAQGWDVPADRAKEAREIVAKAPAKATPRASRYRSTYTRFSSGAEIYTNKNGRCIDAPCCGCCS
jgi:hypothetical protein